MANFCTSRTIAYLLSDRRRVEKVIEESCIGYTSLRTHQTNTLIVQVTVVSWHQR